MKKKINSIFVALFFNALFSFSLMGQNQVFKEAFLSKKSVVLYTKTGIYYGCRKKMVIWLHS